MGFTQRQAAGRFTRGEAEAFIDQLENAGHDVGLAPADEPVARVSAAERAIRRLPTGLLAAELQRRGWIVIEP
jgi:antitoxin (DNA-binding transcriptional repressor) of toxin-antitoxin stability system